MKYARLWDMLGLDWIVIRAGLIGIILWPVNVGLQIIILLSILAKVQIFFRYLLISSPYTIWHQLYYLHCNGRVKIAIRATPIRPTLPFYEVHAHVLYAHHVSQT